MLNLINNYFENHLPSASDMGRAALGTTLENTNKFISHFSLASLGSALATPNANNLLSKAMYFVPAVYISQKITPLLSTSVNGSWIATTKKICDKTANFSALAATFFYMTQENAQMTPCIQDTSTSPCGSETFVDNDNPLKYKFMSDLALCIYGISAGSSAVLSAAERFLSSKQPVENKDLGTIENETSRPMNIDTPEKTRTMSDQGNGS